MVEAAVVQGLAELPPGPQLAAALAGIALSRAGPQQVVEVLRAQSRQLAHEQARMWASLVEVGLAVPQDELGHAETVVRDLPQVFTALAAGHIDRGKAVVFAEFLTPASGEVTAAQAQRICTRLVPLAPRLTTGQLRRALLAIDPTWARRRCERAVRGGVLV